MEGVTASRRPGRRVYVLISVFAVLLVIFPFLFWYGTWFGRELSDKDVESYLDDASKPRRAQHALVQIGERISRGDKAAQRWYPRVIQLAGSPVIELRQTAAWIMGQDRSHQPFHEVLLRLLHDPQPTVRRNAALALANFQDPAARPELIAMLRPFTVSAPAAGMIKYRLQPGEYVNPGTLVARVGETEVRSPLPGEVRALSLRDGASVNSGDAVVELSADKNHAWEALRALLVVGTPEDLDDIRRYARGIPGMPDNVRQQAALTLQSIEARSR